MKIVLIGPVYPYKGGISHYTGIMYQTLAKNYDVTMISYSFQYPKLLYKKEQRDYSNDSFKIDGTYYLINTLSPVNWIRVSRRINDLSPDLVIIQWWHPYFAPCYQSIIRHLKDTRVMFICHNVFPHERFPLDRMLTTQTLRKGDCYIVQSGQDESDLLEIVPGAHYLRAVHPTYNAFKMQDLSQAEARQMLEITEETKVLLFFGFVRKYKGLRYLIEAMPRIVRSLTDVKLMIVGDFGDHRCEYMDQIERTGVKDHISIYDGYIPDREVEKFFAACDVVVLPYISATQSGIVQIAYGFEKPVIATNVGGLPDVVADGKTGYLVSAEAPVEIADAVIRFYENGSQSFVQNVKNEAYRFSWDRMVENIEELTSAKM